MKYQMKRVRIPRYRGVYYRDSSDKRHQGKPDRCFDISYKNLRGKLVWEKVGWTSEGYTAATALGLRAERMRSLRHGREIPQKRDRQPTLGEVWERYDEWLETGKKRPRDDRGLYANHIKTRFAERTLSQIGSFDLEKMKMDLTKQGLSPASVKHCLVLVRQLINKAISWGMWQGENPVKKVKMPRLNNRREKFLTIEEAHSLLDILRSTSPRLYDISLLSLHTGMRMGEILNLKWGHVDLRNGLIHVADPKGGTSRKAFMTDSLKGMFSSRDRGDPEELVFQTKQGERIKEVSNFFARVVRRLGLNDGISDPRQKVTFHTLRHTFASWLALSGTPILTIKELLGHKTLAMTERYAHLSKEHKQEAVQVIDKIFFPATDKALLKEKPSASR